MSVEDGPEGLRDLAVREGVATACASGWSAPGPQGEIFGDSAVFFDLASLTKPMLALALVRSGLDPKTPLGALVEEARETPSAEATLEALLAHRAGLEANLPLFAPLLEGKSVDLRAALRLAAEARRPDAVGRAPAEGFAPLYSDLGYILAGEALARHLGVRDAGEAIFRELVVPLGLAAELGTARELAARGIDLASRAAPTEDAPWRGGIVRGVVHDENAWALTRLGGSGHAGMFGTVAAVLAVARFVIEEMDRGAALETLVRPRAGGTLRAGFDGKSPEGSSAGGRIGPRAFGHLGFTGTSFWIDPDARVAVALLTNRVHPTRDNAKIRTLRPRAHDALVLRAEGRVKR